MADFYVLYNVDEYVDLDIFGNRCFDIEYDVHFNFYPGDPGYLMGAMEDCREPEPDEYDVVEVYVHSVVERFQNGTSETLSISQINKIEDELLSFFWNYVAHSECLEEAMREEADHI